MPRRKGSDIQAMQNAAKTLLANIRFAAIDKPIKTLTITSTRPNEGKTFVACALAEAASTSGRHVLIVECDMRHRSVGGELDIHGTHGLYSVLSGHHKLEDVIVPTRQKNLDFLDVEPGIPNPPDVISSKRFHKLVRDLRQDYDLVIFDTPPVGAFVDAAYLSALTDGCIFVIRENFTKREVAVDALDQLRKAGANVLGSVLNGCEDTSTGYYEYYYRERETPTSSVVEEPLEELPREGHVRLAASDSGESRPATPTGTAAKPAESAASSAAKQVPSPLETGEFVAAAGKQATPAQAPAAPVATTPSAASAPQRKPAPSETAAFVIAAQQSAQQRKGAQQPAAAQPASLNQQASASASQAVAAQRRQAPYRGLGTAAQPAASAATGSGKADARAASSAAGASAVPVVPVMHGSATAKNANSARQAGPYVPPKNNPYAR